MPATPDEADALLDAALRHVPPEALRRVLHDCAVAVVGSPNGSLTATIRLLRDRLEARGTKGETHERS